MFHNTDEKISVEIRIVFTPRFYRRAIKKKLTPWLMEPGDWIQHSKWFSNNPYPELNQHNFPHF
jgi:hypothetical protein